MQSSNLFFSPFFSSFFFCFSSFFFFIATLFLCCIKGAPEIVMKAQVFAGGRGKGVFSNGFKGGVQLSTDPAEVRV